MAVYILQNHVPGIHVISYPHSAYEKVRICTCFFMIKLLLREKFSWAKYIAKVPKPRSSKSKSSTLSIHNKPSIVVKTFLSWVLRNAKVLPVFC